MALKFYNGSAWFTANVKFWNGSAWFTPNVKFFNGTDWFSVTALTAVASPTSASGSSGSPGFVTSENVTCTVNRPGGTFVWTRVSGSSAITATASGSATTAFAANMSTNGTINATFRCTYTLNGEDVVSNDVDVSLTLF